MKTDHDRFVERRCIEENIKRLAQGIGPSVTAIRIAFYSDALCDLTMPQLEYAFETARTHLGEFLPSVGQLREWAETYKPPAKPIGEPAARVDCGLCHGDGRLTVVWLASVEEVTESDTVRAKLTLLRAVPYTETVYLMPGETTSIYRCLCENGMRHPMRWPRFSKTMNAVRYDR